MSRWTVELHQDAAGWWWRHRRGWWGAYKTEGHARGAAKRSINPVAGGKTNPKDFEFKLVDVNSTARVQKETN